MTLDEGTALVRSLGQYKNGKGSEKQFYMSAQFCAMIRQDRRGRPDDPIVVPEPFLAISGNLPPDMLAEFREERGRQDGFLERILISFPEPRPKPLWKVWYFTYIDANGRPTERKGCPDKRATEELARSVETDAVRFRYGLVDPKEEAYRSHDARPLAEHMEDWKSALLARSRTAKHADLYHGRATRLVGLAGVEWLTDLQPSKIQAALAKLRDKGRSLETCNHHRASIRAFVRWAAPTAGSATTRWPA